MDKIVKQKGVDTVPKVSIITVVYNAVSTIEATIQSVVGQQSDEIEYIIIDGGSTDGTIDIIKKYNDEIAFWISEPDNGIYDAMNKGVAFSNGKWKYFLGGDDILICRINEIISLLTNDVILYGNVIYSSTKKLYCGRFNSIKLLSKNIPHQAIFYPSSVFEKYLFDTKYKLFADYYLNILCWNDSKFRFKYVKKVIANYSDNGQSSNGFDLEFLKDQFVIFFKNMPFFLLPFVFVRKFHTLLKYRNI